MGTYSTRTITRSRAIEMIVEKMQVQQTNEELGNLLDRLYSEETLDNYRVVDDKNYNTEEN